MEMKTDRFQSWHIECGTLTASSFRILNSSMGILTPPLTLLIAMLPKALLTSDSRMFGFRWVTTTLWLSGSLRPFLYSSSVLLLLGLYCFWPLSCPSLPGILNGRSFFTVWSGRRWMESGKGEDRIKEVWVAQSWWKNWPSFSDIYFVLSTRFI